MAKITVYQPSGTSEVYRVRSRYSLRLWSVRHSRFLEIVYNLFADSLLALHPLWNWIGYARVERPMVAVEKFTKEILFDCRMCGRCVLSSTGMSCPMNCPKNLRNGPCGGVRADGHCEVEPDMPCVWVQAWQGSQRMKATSNILDVQKPVDHSIQGTSAWLRACSERAEEKIQERKEEKKQEKSS